MLNSTHTLRSSESISSYATTGTASDVTFRAVEEKAQERKRSLAVVDKLLQWMREANVTDTPTPLAANIESAIDLVVDSRDRVSVPTSVALTDDDGVAFEWNLGDEIISIEILASGIAEKTRFRGGRVIEEAVYVRNPQTRRLELRGASDA